MTPLSKRALRYRIALFFAILAFLAGCSDRAETQKTTASPIPASPTDNPLQSLRTKAASGDSEAQYQLGLQLYRSPDRRVAEAADWFRKAGENGHVEAMTALAILAKRGEGVTENKTISKQLLSQAAEKGDWGLG